MHCHAWVLDFLKGSVLCPAWGPEVPGFSPSSPSRVCWIATPVEQSTVRKCAVYNLPSGRASQPVTGSLPAKEVGLGQCQGPSFNTPLPVSAPGTIQHSFQWVYKLPRLENASLENAGRPKGLVISSSPQTGSPIAQASLESAR